MIIFRYLAKELTVSLSALMGILLLIFLSNQFVRFLSQVASGKYGIGLVLKFIASETPYLVSLLLPLGLFLSILLVYSRMYVDNEMTVLHACGLSRLKLVALTLPLALTITAISALLSLWINPQLLAYQHRLFAETGTAMQLEAMVPGRFQETNNGQRIFYIENLSPDHKQMRNIFMAQLAQSSDDPNIAAWIIATAKSGHQVINPTTGDHFFEVQQGKRYQGTPGFKNFQIATFDSYGIRIQKRVSDVINQADSMSTLALWNSYTNKPFHISELQWRFSAPLSVLLLTLLAIPLSRIKPRQSRYVTLVPAILLYIIYVNLLLIGRSWIEQGSLPPYLGMWWIHVGLFITIIFIWLWQTGWKTLKAAISV